MRCLSITYAAGLLVTTNAALCVEASSSQDKSFDLNKNALEIVAEIGPNQPIHNTSQLPQSAADHQTKRAIQPAPLWVFGAGILSVVFLSVCIRRTAT